MALRLRTLLPLLVVLALLAAAGPSPAAAQDPGPRQPDPNVPVRMPELCVPTGLALAVIAESGTIAEVLPARNANDTATGTSFTARLVVDAPAAVGACADFNGFWGEGAGGAETATLRLFDANAATVADPGEPLARDGVRETRRGPSRLAKPLKAVTKIEKPGTYTFVAVLDVTAGTAATDVAGTKMAKDTHRMRFTVTVRERPQPGQMTGQVLGADGNAVAGAQVVAIPAANVVARPGPGNTLPVLPPVLDPALPGEPVAPLGVVEPDQIGSSAGRTFVAQTGRDGRYRMELPTGRYFVMAAARGFTPQWYDGVPSPDKATPVPVRAGELTEGIDFMLKPAVEPQPRPQPQLKSSISGTVFGADGTLLEGAFVQAVPPRTASGSTPGNTGRYAARVDENGEYTMPVPAGRWLVQAQAPGYAPLWYDGAADVGDATLVGVADDQAVEGIDFGLMPAAPRPEPQPDTRPSISGTIVGPDGPAEGAIVMAVLLDPNRPAPVPGQPDQTRRLMARTDENGEYALRLAPGTYVVGAGDRRSLTAAGEFKPLVWWDGQEKLEDADPVVVAERDAIEGIDFTLPR